MDPTPSSTDGKLVSSAGPVSSFVPAPTDPSWATGWLLIVTVPPETSDAT